ncbi:MAG TPA: hypothetical protein VGV89_05565 [Thermoplasmata archaeon]|nr:hypothetical protein [Thermoplasmata archaeon]
MVAVLALIPAFASGAPVHAAPAPLGVHTGEVAVAAPGAGTGSSNLVSNPRLASLPAPTMGHFTIPGPHPASWGTAGIPPGWEALLPSPSASSPSSSWGSSTPNWLNRFCAGIWPGFDSVWGSNPQSAYGSGCYGHDEPGIQFYSTLPGSGGNVTWNVTLPVDRAPTMNQSDLYSAMWFGMALHDPGSWIDQCFLELQFYPDQLWTNPGPIYPNYTVNGAWIGAAVAWHIDVNGNEDPCFYEPLYLNGTPGPAYLNMTQGDRISVTMTGWQSNPLGELVSIHDLSAHQRSFVRLYDTAGGYPLNPAYSTNSYPAAFQWTPGGEYPVVFAFETGHAGNPSWPSNNSYGGCSGGPKSTPTDPGAPCPSYDPGSWANDTRSPWHIDAPTFFNARAKEISNQVAFTQPEGGMNLVDQTSNGVCVPAEGSAWCSYPWYSYYCGAHTFEFGALDYPGVTTDFGKFTQFDRNLAENAMELGFFPPTNFTVPSCTGTGSTVSVGSTSASAGSAYFLSHDYAAATAVRGVSDGEYSLSAIPTAGEFFSHWTTTGGVSVTLANSEWTTIDVTGSGSVTAAFTRHPALTTVTFNDLPGSGRVGLTASFFQVGAGLSLATIPNGGSYALPPGVYSIEGYAPVGYNFSSWSSASSGVQIAAPGFPVTWLTVTGSATTATVTAHDVRSVDLTTLGIYVVGSGSWRVGALTVTNAGGGFNFGQMTMHVGTYASTITPARGTLATTILYGTSIVMVNFSMHSLVMLENATPLLEVIFTAPAHLTFSSTPAAGGQLELVGSAGPPQLLSSGTTALIPQGVYEAVGVPNDGYAFLGWSSSNSTTIAISSTTSVATIVTVAGSGTLTASFVKAAHSMRLGFIVRPNAGRVLFNAQNLYLSGASNGSLGGGQYLVSAVPAPGWSFVGWAASGHVSFVTSSSGATAIVLVTGGGTLTAVLHRTLVAVTFVAYNPSGSGASPAVLSVAGHHLHSGETIYVPMGTHAIVLTSSHALLRWEVTPGLTVGTGTSTTLDVGGAGTVYAVL